MAIEYSCTTTEVDVKVIRDAVREAYASAAEAGAIDNHGSVCHILPPKSFLPGGMPDFSGVNGTHLEAVTANCPAMARRSPCRDCKV